MTGFGSERFGQATNIGFGNGSIPEVYLADGQKRMTLGRVRTKLTGRRDGMRPLFIG